MLFQNEKVKVFRSEDYNYNFSKETGYFERWGKELKDDPDYAPLPEISDIEVTTICSKKCSECSPAGTKVLTINGEKNIEEVKEGDEIISYNLKENKKEVNIVKETYTRDFIGEIIEIKLKSNRILRLTPDHEVFTKRGWITAENLKETDELLDF